MAPRTDRRLGILLASIVFFAPVVTGSAAQVESDAPSVVKAAFWSGEPEYDFSFEGVFPKPIYQKSYFTWLMLGASVVVAGALCYFTAGAGAPAAATGVSTVASTIAGGGAGSYMAGLSIVGGWFGGNAMLGSAILNGIALGLGGGGTAFTTMSAVGKVGVMASVTATALDGVLVYLPPDKKELVYRVRLPVPDRIGSDKVKGLVDELNDIDSDAVKLSKEIEEDRSERRKDKEAPWETALCPGVRAALETLEKANADDDLRKPWELRAQGCDLLEKRAAVSKKVSKKAGAALQSDVSSEDLLALAILSKNEGDEKTYAQLLARIRPETVTNRSYLDYLHAVTSIERGNLNGAEALLKRSWGASPYAVEPALLLINVLGHKGILKQEKEIIEAVERAEEMYDRDDYASNYSLLALYYRVAAMYFLAQRYPEAEGYYRKAYDELPWAQEYFGSPQLRNLIQLGIANSLYGQGKLKRANKLFEELIDEAETDGEKDLLKSQYVPNLPDSKSSD